MAKSELPAVDCREFPRTYLAFPDTCTFTFITVEKGKSSDYDDAGSVSSANTAYSMMGEEVIDAEADVFSQAIDDTYESRAATREKAWERMVTMLRSNVRIDDCFQSASSLVSRCSSAIRKGGAAEAASAATALALHLLTLGEPSESTFLEVKGDLVKAAKQGKGAAVKVAAADALAVCCFVAAEDEHTTQEVMDQLYLLWGKDSPKLKAAALRGWSFLYTSLNTPLGSRQLETQLAALAGLLHDADVEVRQAAGEVLALLYNTCSLREELEDDDDDDDDGRRDHDEMSLVSNSSVSGLEMVMERVRDLATNRGDRQRRNKRERVALKGCFRELRSVMEDGHVPEQRIKLRHGDTLIINTMEGNTMINYFKRFLAVGFQVHLQCNPLLHAIFGFTPLDARPERMSAQEKRLFKSPSSAASKARSQTRRSQRSYKGAGGGEDW
eukprot:gene6732-6952_t